jgi:hypothetical protein
LFGLVTAAVAGESLDPLVNASVGFSMANAPEWPRYAF